MLPLLVGITAVTSVLMVVAFALTITQKMRSARNAVQEFVRGGTGVVAIITDVQIKQGWKEGERWERNLWDGTLMRQKTWQTYYDVTAHWLHPQTEKKYTFCSKVWSDDVAKIPTAGDAIIFIVDLRHPQRYALDLQSTSDEMFVRTKEENLCVRFLKKAGTSSHVCLRKF
jgi:hypothetical protein